MKHVRLPRRAAVPAAGPIAFFGHDAYESTLRKRIRALQDLGREVVGYTFRRKHSGSRMELRWPNVDLGLTEDRNYLRRLPVLAAGLARALLRGKPARNAEVFYARNIDMLAVAWMVKVLTRSRAPLVYEVLDVQRSFLGRRPVSRAFRMAERFLLRRCQMLVVSSPTFMSAYFEPVQGYRGRWYLLENKISGEIAPRPKSSEDPPAPNGPWVIGWFGILRCVRSLELLSALADRLGDRVEIRIGGRTSEEDLPLERLMAEVRQRPNMSFGGAYANPADLSAIYADVHLSWCVDFLDAGTNSDWLLPNRLYEGGYFGVVAIARESTATGDAVKARDLGWSVAEPMEENVLRLIDELSWGEYVERRSRILEMPRSLFVDEHDTRNLIDSLTATGEVAPARTARSALN